MPKLIKAQEPFRFFSRLHLGELTGLRASNIEELLQHIKEVPGSCIYHHTHRFLQIHQYLSPEPPNDFAYWISEILGEDELGERLASIDTVQFTDIRSLREKTIQTIEDYVNSNPRSKLKFARPGEEFHFIRSVSFVFATNYVAYDLKGFVDALRKIAFDSIYFHIFEARLRLGKTTNDFSYWIETSLGKKKLANKIAHLDPYTRTLEDLRQKLIEIVEREIHA